MVWTRWQIVDLQPIHFHIRRRPESGLMVTEFMCSKIGIGSLELRSVNPAINTSSKAGFSCVAATTTAQPAHVSTVSVPTCRVSPPDERGDGRGGRVHLLPGHLWPGEQRLRQLLHQTGALRSRCWGQGWTNSFRDPLGWGKSTARIRVESQN